MNYSIYTDGSCRGNGKIESTGGFGVVVIENIDGKEKLFEVYSKQCEQTTNNKEELKAIVWTMLKYGHNINNEWGTIPVVYSDSSYCVNTFNEWMFNWARNNWIKSDKSTENLDLIKAYFEHWTEGYRIDLRKVKGHSTDKWNNVADKLATKELTAEEVYKIYG